MKLVCCWEGCGAEAEYEVWYEGRPVGFDAWTVVDGLAKYENYTHACWLHLEDLKLGSVNDVIHLSRAVSPTSIEVSFNRPRN